MKKHAYLISAAAMAVTGLVWAQGMQSGDRMSDQPRTGDSMHQMQTHTQMGAAKQVEADDAREIRAVIAQTAEAALTRDGLDDLTERLSKADRDRIGEITSTDMQQLNTQIDQLRNAWKTKYNQDFDIKNEEVAFANFQIYQGMMGEARPAGERQQPEGSMGPRSSIDRSSDIPSRSNDSAAKPGLGGVTGGGTADRVTDQPRTDVAIDTNRDDQALMAAETDRGDMATETHATVVVPANPQHKAQQVTVHLVNEGTLTDAWRIDIPDTINRQQLRDNLSRHLTEVTQSQSSWPTDVNEAYTFVSHHVLAALTDTGMTGMQPGMPRTQQPGMQGTQQPSGQPQRQGTGGY